MCSSLEFWLEDRLTHSLLDNLLTRGLIGAMRLWRGAGRNPFLPTTHAGDRITILFLAAAAVAVLVLVWMGMRLVRQDRALEERRLEERREGAADRLVALLEQALAAEEKRLAESPGDFAVPAEDAVMIVAGPAGIRTGPEQTLLYYPDVPERQETWPGLYAAAERAEFEDRNYDKAILALRRLSASADAVVRAGARVRLARNLRKAGRGEEALAVYDELAKTGAREVTASGTPVDLAALRASCALLDELGRIEESQEKARMLRDGLLAGRWRLDRESYHYYRGQMAQWLGEDAASDPQHEALAEAACWVARNWCETRAAGQDSSGRQSLRYCGRAVTVLWRASADRLTAFVAGPAYQKERWFEPAFRNAGSTAVKISLTAPDRRLSYGEPVPENAISALRPAVATGLPWNLSVANADIEVELSQFAQRRRLMTAGLGLLVAVLIAAGCLMGRAVTRELAAARLQSDFVSAVSHEFRTPLTSMRQFTEMLVENEKLAPEKRRAFHQAQERATRRLSRLVESLLDFGRMEADSRPYLLEPLDVGPLVRDVVKEFRREASPAGFAIECNVPEAGVVAKGDREALAQALWYLLDNAVKYSGDNRTVCVEVENGGRVSIRVRDRGIGVPLSEHEQIMRKFSRGSGATEHGIKGTGIGLAMVKHIVDAHGGEILIDSEPGKGSTFTIRLPTGG